MKRSRVAFFCVGWLAMVLYFSQRWLFGPLIPELMSEFHLDKTQVGVLGSASVWGYMITPIIAGLLSDRFSRKYITLGGIFGFSALAVICGMVVSYQQMFIVRLLTGAAEAFFFVPLIAYTLDLFPERPAFYLTLMSSGSSLGWFTGPALAGWLLEMSSSWRIPFLVVGVIGLIVASLLFYFWPGEQKEHRPSAAFFDKEILKPVNLLMLLLLSAAMAFQISAEFGFTMWYPAILELEFGMTATAAGILTGMYGMGQLVGRPVMGWVCDRLTYRLVGIISALLLGTSFLFILVVHSTALRAALTLEAGFIGAGVMGALWTFTGLTFPSSRGLALGVITSLGYATASLSLILIGWMGDRYALSTGLKTVIIPAAFLVALVFFSTYLLKPKRRRENR